MFLKKTIVAIAILSSSCSVSGITLNKKSNRAAVSPVENVVMIITDMEHSLIDEKIHEDALYSTFACGCKTETTDLVSSINGLNDEINTESAEVELQHGNREKAKKDLRTAQDNLETHKSDKVESIESCAAKTSNYTTTLADLNNAVDALTNALAAAESGKPALIQEAITVARAHDPRGEYEYHSDGIVTVLTDMKNEFTDKKNEVDRERALHETACSEAQVALETKVQSQVQEIDSQSGKIQDAATALGEARKKLETALETIQADEKTLNSVTKNCEARGKDYDQRTEIRDKELSAIHLALEVLGEKVVDTEQHIRRARNDNSYDKSPPPALIQIKARKSVSSHKLGLQERLTAVVQSLSKEGHRLGSESLLALSSMAKDTEGDHPLKTVNDLIQKLIERLLREAAAEAKQHGFCKSTLAKIETERSTARTQAKKLNAVIDKLEIHREELQALLQEMHENCQSAKATLEENDAARTAEHDAHMNELKEGRAGLAGLKEAHEILREFYHTSSHIKGGPSHKRDFEDAEKNDFEGNYKGNQSGGNQVLALLGSLVTDYEQAIKATETAEKESATSYQEIRELQSVNLEESTTAAHNANKDFNQAQEDIMNNMKALQAQVDIVDENNKEYSLIRKECVDPGDTFAEKQAKMQEEIDALKNAYAALNEGVALAE